MKQIISLIIGIGLSIFSYGQTCDYTITTDSVSCSGRSDGGIEVNFTDWGCDNGNTGCVDQEFLAPSYYAGWPELNGGDVTVLAGEKYVLNSGNYNTVDVKDGGEIIILGTSVSVSNFSFNGGTVTFAEDFTINQISINSDNSVIRNYKFLKVTNGVTFKGSLYNYGTLEVDGNFNVNAGNHYFENRHVVNFKVSFNNKFNTVNYGTFNQLGGDFHNNGSGTFTNHCTLNVTSGTNGFFINDAAFHNYGTVDIAEGSRFNGGSELFSYAGSNFTTKIIQNLDGKVTASTDGCSQLEITGTAAINTSASLTGDLSLCGYDIATAPAGVIASSVVNDCDCAGSTSEAGVVVIWSDGGTGNTRTDLPAGNYTFSASCGTCNVTDVPVIVGEPALLTVSLSKTNETEIDACDGEINPIVSGGTKPYTYSWSNGTTNKLATSLCADDYTVTITDANGCTITSEISTIEEGGPVCAIDFEICHSEAICAGNANGFIEVCIDNEKITGNNTGGTEILGNYSGCAEVQEAPANLCATCQQSFGGNYASLSSGTACLTTGFNGNVDLNGGTLIICGDDVTINNINYEGGDIIVLGENVFLPNINMNSLNSTLTNYGSIRTTNFTFNGAVINHGSLMVDAHFNVNQSTASIHNTGTLTVSNNFAINTTILNDGFVHVTGEYFLINGDADLTNNCRIIVGGDAFGKFIDNGTVINNGGIKAGFNFRLNSGGTYTGGEGSLLTTLNTEMLDGTFQGPATGCTQLEVTGNFQYNGSMVLAGNVSLCGFEVSNITAGTVGANVVTSCTSCNTTTGTTAGVTDPSIFEGFTFTWTGVSGTTTSDYRVDGLAPGTYSVTVSNGECSKTYEVTIPEVANSLSTSFTYQEVSGDAACDNTATVTLLSGDGPVYYEWYLNGFIYREGIDKNSYSDLCSGSYKVVITDANGCQDDYEFKIGTDKNCVGFGFTFDETAPSCDQKADGELGAIITGGEAPYSYLWNRSSTVEKIENAVASQYILKLTDAKGCVFEDDIDLMSSGTCPECENTTLMATASVDKMPSCIEGEANTTCDGEITLAATGGISPLTYYLNEVKVDATALTQPICSGTQYIKVVDANDCYKGFTEATDPCEDDLCKDVSIHLGTEDTRCPDVATGEAVLTITGGASPYHISFNHGAFVSSIENIHYYPDLGKRRVTVEVIDHNGCTLDDADNVGQLFDTCDGDSVKCDDPIVIDIEPFDTKCINQESGVVIATVDFPYTEPIYYWNDVKSVDLVLSELAAGPYRLRVVDKITGCFNEETGTVNNGDDCDPCADFKITKGETSEGLCSGAGSVNITATAGFGPYTIYIDGIEQEGKVATDNFDVTGLAPGTHRIKVKSFIGCVDFIDATFIGNGNTPLVIETVRIIPESCNPGNDGEIIINYDGGFGHLTATWTDLASKSPIRTGLSAGTYEFTITDETACPLSKTFVVLGQSASINISTTTKDATSEEICDGKIIIDNKSATNTLKYEWSNTTEDIAVNPTLCKGYYTVHITDEATGCVTDLGFNIFTKPCAPENITLETGTEFIPGEGVYATVTLEGCDPNITKNCLPPVIDLSAACSASCDRYLEGSTGTQVGSGEQVCIAAGKVFSGNLDMNGGHLSICGTFTGNVNIDQGATLEVNGFVDASNITLNDGGTLINRGVIKVDDIFINSGFTNFGTVEVTNLFTLNSQGTVTNNGPITVESAILNGTLTEGTCGEFIDNTIVTICPLVTWSPSGETGLTSPALDCDEDNNAVTIEFCDGTSTTLPVDAACYELVITGIVTNGSCQGGLGSIDATITTNQENPTLSYAWFNATTNAAIGVTTEDVADLEAGDYYLQVTDGNNVVTTSETFTIIDAPVLVVTTGKSPTCKDGATGGASAIATGGTGFGTYRYAWTSITNPSLVIANANGAEITGLEEGTYEITVLDNNDCPVSEIAIVENTGEVCLLGCEDFTGTGVGTGPSCKSESDGYATLTITGGNGNHYLKNGETLDNFTSGVHSITVYEIINDIECPATIPVIIPASAKDCPEDCVLEAELVPTNPTCKDDNNGRLELIITGVDVPEDYTINWSHIYAEDIADEQLLVLENLANKQYEVTVVHNTIDDCRAWQKVTLEVPTPAEVYANNFEVCEIDPKTFTSGQATGNVWTNEAGEVLSTTDELVTGTIGTYTLTIDEGECPEQMLTYELTQALNCPDDTTGTRYFCDPFLPPTVTIEEPCSTQFINEANIAAQGKYRLYLDRLREDFQREYIKKCLSSQETMATSYEDGEYHYTLYYYDQGGNLTRTVPPAGVKPINDQATLNKIVADRKNNEKTIFTEHTYKTTYTYNSLNQLVGQDLPDHETMDIFEVDQEGYNNGIEEHWDITGLEIGANGEGFITAIDGDEGVLLSTIDHGRNWTEATTLGLVTLEDVQIIDATNAVAVGGHGTFVKSVNAGEKWIPYPVGTAEDFRFVHFTNAANGTIWTAKGKSWITTDGGASWNTGSGISSVTTGTIKDLRFSSITEGALLVLQNGYSQIFTTVDGGTTWSTNPTLEDNITIPTLTDFYATSGANITAVGTDGLVIKSTDGGATWELKDNQSTLDFQNLQMVTATSGSSVINGALYKTTDGGDSWNTAADITDDITNYNRRADGKSIFVTDNQGLWLSTNAGVSFNKEITPTYTNIEVADVRDNGLTQLVVVRANGSLHISYDQGEEWYNITPETAFGTIIDIHQADENQLIALTTTGALYNLTNAGLIQYEDLDLDDEELVLNWEENTNLTDVAELFFTNDLEGTATKTDGSLYSTTDGGLTWTAQSTNYTAAGTVTEQQLIGNIHLALVDGELFVNEGTTWNSLKTSLETDALQGLYKSGNTTYATGNNGVVVSSTDNATWNLAVESTKAGLNSVALNSANAPVAVATEGSIHQQEAGAWNVTRSVQETHALNEVFVLGTNDVYAVGDDATIYNFGFTNNTSDITPVDLGSITDDLHAVDALSNSYVLAVGEGGKIVKFNGTTWDCVTLVDPLTLNATEMLTSEIGFGVGNNGTVVKTIDGGATWDNQNSSQTANLKSISGYDLNNAIAVGEAGAIIRTTNGGTDHFAANVTAPSTVNNLCEVAMITATTGYAVGDNGTVWRTTNGGANWTVQTTTGTSQNLKAIYFHNTSYGFVAGAEGTVLLYNGTSWEDRSLEINNVSIKEQINDLYFVDNLTGYAITEKGNVYKTITAGDTWEDSNISDNAPGALALIKPIDKNQFFVVGESGTLIRVNDETNLYSSKFWYDRLGRLVLSQNAKQFGEQNQLERDYSYTKYDHLGRIIEVGEATSAESLNGYVEQSHRSQFRYVEGEEQEDKFLEWLDKASGRREVNVTIYDETSSLVSVPDFTQDHLRNRVANVFYYEGSLEEGYTSASHYSYDIHGNVETLVQDYPDLASLDQQYKRMDYDYDLVSGNVHMVSYQDGQADQFFHRYAYDSDNRIILTETSRDGVSWDKDAKNVYYKHGPLGRMEIGENQVQGMDYVYTIHGWLKGVNAASLDQEYDPGQDGLDNKFAKDECAYNLNYYGGDYSAINSPANNFLVDVSNSDLEGTQQDLYNGNISQMVTGIRAFMQGTTDGTDLGPQGMNYTYDQLNRLKTANAYGSTSGYADNTWGTTTAKEEYAVQLNYDPNGNILDLERKGSAEENLEMDDMHYIYATKATGNKKNTNRLQQVIDEVSESNYEQDIDSQDEYNYEYDKIGQLVRDKAEQLTIKWNVQNKVTEVIKDEGIAGQDLEFKYDAMGNRMIKIVKPRTEQGVQDQSGWIYTYYVRDASGNVMTIYNKKYDDLGANTYKEKLAVTDYNLFGSDRLGTYKNDLEESLVEREFISVETNEDGSFVESSSNVSVSNETWDLFAFNHYVGHKSFEGKNHLGNVLTVCSDAKLAIDIDNDGFVDHYHAKTLSASDYYPFGMLMPDRTMSASDYRYGFNGMEKDDEIKGSGNSYTTLFRQYDPRLGRWLSLDPKMAKFPSQSPFVAFNNNPVYWTDPFGDDPPEGTEKKTGVNGTALLLPKGTKTTQFKDTNGDGKMTLIGSEVELDAKPGDIRSFTLGDKTYKGEHNKEGKFLGYYSGTNKYVNPDVKGKNAGSDMAVKNGNVGPDFQATLEFSNVEASSIQVIQTFTSTESTIQGKKGVSLGNGTYGYLDAANFTTNPYYYNSDQQEKATTYSNSSNTSGQFVFSDFPYESVKHDNVQFQTSIIAVNYMGTGKDVVLKSFNWSVPQGSYKAKISKATLSPATRKIINSYLPNYNRL